MKKISRPQQAPQEAVADPLLFTLLRTAEALRQRLEDALKAVGLSGAKMEVLDQLVRAGEPVSLRVLANAQRCAPSNMTTLMDRLEADGLVRRVSDSADRRSVRAQLTAKGRERSRVGMAVAAKVQHDFAESMAVGDRETLRRTLKSMH